MTDERHCDTCRCSPEARANDALSDLAVDWLINSLHMDSTAHQLFKAIENGEITPEEADTR